MVGKENLPVERAAGRAP